MLDDAQARIFLASERDHTETDWFRSYNSFRFGQYKDESKPAFGPLYVLNDDTLAGGHKFSLQIEEPTDLLLLPVVGAVGCRYGDSETVVHAGELQCCPLEAGMMIELFNPYEEDLINFLQLWIRQPFRTSDEDESLTVFDLNGNKNQWMDLIAGQGAAPIYQIFIAKMDGRAELERAARQPGSGFFVFVIEGAFEVQHRLLEARDGLSLLGVSTLEVEALSNEAILLVIELAPF